VSGIAAVLHFDGSRVACGTVEDLTHEMHYRGPDGIAHWHDGSAALGFCAQRRFCQIAFPDGLAPNWLIQLLRYSGRDQHCCLFGLSWPGARPTVPDVSVHTAWSIAPAKHVFRPRARRPVADRFVDWCLSRGHVA
jgi:hypothetical protein